jgi:peptidoglycan/xylan/chitin deacetylase (PgdA/CDA1 family)
VVSRRALLAAAAGSALVAGCSDGSAGSTATRRSGSPTASPSGTTPTSTAASATTTAPTTRVREAVEVRHGSRTAPQVALTFHGSGDPALAKKLLHTLETHRVRATVMAVGTWLQAEPAMARRITSAGHELGNHTLHHYAMRTLAPRTTFDEIDGCARVLRHLTGAEGTWFRASGTQATTATIRRAAERAGYNRCISYDVDGLDWQDPSAATVTSAVLDGTRKGSIISLHLGHPVTITALPDVLDGLTARGLKPVTLSDLLA